MAEYQNKLAQYRSDSQTWAAMSDDQRRSADVAEEKGRLGIYAALLGAALGGIAWTLANKEFHSDGLYGCLTAGLGGGAFYLIPPLRYLAGHLARAMAMAVAYGFVGWLAASFLAGMSQMIAQHLDAAKAVGIVLGIVCALIAEFAGLHHASAAPKEPQPPKP